MDKSVIEVLTEARAKVAQGWCQGSSAKDADNCPCAAKQHDACAWCASGAILKASTSDWQWLTVARVVDDVCLESFGVGLVPFNDNPNRTQADVLKLFDKAIAKAREPKVTTEEVVR